MAERSVPSLLLITLSLLGLNLHAVEGHINAIYVFGDSTVDVGNNNYLPLLTSREAKANFPHYGIDFPTSTPTGRFSNGLNAADQLAILLGFPMSPPPYLSLTPENFTMQMFRGVNFASGGSGIHEYTGSRYKVISMAVQIQYFAMVSGIITKLMGPVGASDFLSRCLFLISTGSNDMFEYSFAKRSSRDDAMFLAGLTSTYKEHLKALYNLGARKFGIVSVPPLGCCPSQRARNHTGGCYEMLNGLSGKFYPAIGEVLQNLHSELPDMKYALGNSFSMVGSILESPKPKFKELKFACCGYGKFYGEYQCNQTFPYCANRTEYLFWDWFHPTQAASEMAAEALYGGSKKIVTPMNFKQLAENDR
ncbi:GDSL esterase/lipase At5g55050-like [Phoenix dactylifera]|uniref:GDSL esterase/lipase At5g55050-like n=1 Tax=Phoenix dactylifera TaxID=42345 RepID=A0A8B7D4R2_PHODC|nr:GDSL esterase/lipase At5g55050-like [Phoenix dactylifera]